MIERKRFQIEELGEERARLAADTSLHASGRGLARALTAALDRAILGLLPSEPADGWAVVAVGGYGRGDLSPHSDVDLLVLRAHRDAAVDRLANDLFYALWDAGLHLLPGVRTVAESRRLADDDLATRTAALDARLLAGDRALYEEFARATLADARQARGRAFLRALAAENTRRRAHAAGSAQGLEPDVKEGRGGLRDAQAMGWAGLVLAGAAEPADLAGAGYLDADEAATVEAAVEFLLRVRHQLHFLAGRKADRLFFEYQADVASRLGYPEANGHLPAERLMREVNAHAEELALAADALWEHVAETTLARPSPVAPVLRAAAAAFAAGNGASTIVHAGRLRLNASAAPPGEPSAALALYANAAARGVLVGHTLARAMRTALAGAPRIGVWTDEERQHILAVLRAGERAPDLLESMAGCGLLPLYLPEWNEIRHLARQDALHQYTVDRHSIAVVGELNKISSGQGPEGSFGATLSAAVADFDLLLLAGLLHDQGKGREGDHSLVGAELSATIGERMGLSFERRESLAFLVHHHLLLARVASRRDLDDPELVARLAELIEDAERLRMLYLLTVADSVATGPGVWSEWKATLVRDLFFRLLSALDGEGEPTTAERLARRRQVLRQALTADADPARVDEFLSQMPAAYIYSQSAEAACEHMSLLGRARGGAVQVAAKRSPDGIHDELTLAARDRPGLLWRICGVFALHGVNILEARVFTDNKGTVLDIFRLADAFEASITAEKRQAVERDLELALAGRLSLGYRLARKLSHYRPRKPLPTPAPRVSIDNSASADYTVIEIHAPDRLGLLYHLTRALSDLNLDIHLAKISTRGPEAVDVFYVRDLGGLKVLDPDHTSEIEHEIQFELAKAEDDLRAR